MKVHLSSNYLLSLSLLIIVSFSPPTNAQSDRSSLMGLISTRDIAELTQIATELAAQTMQSNGELINKPGRPEVKPISLNASPSEILGQSLTNMMSPATQQLAQALSGGGGGGRPPMTMMLQQQQMSDGDDIVSTGGGGLQSLFRMPRIPMSRSSDTPRVGQQQQQQQMGSSLMELAQTFFRGGGASRASRGGDDIDVAGEPLMSRLFSAATGATTQQRQPPSASAKRASTMNSLLPSLQQLMPGASRNFGFQQGEGCLPFVGEFMRVIYGNCVRQADEKTWDLWGKEITTALMGGKIDLLRASKETCKKGAEREQCGQLRRAVSECDIIGSIQLASNMQRAVSRCDEISGIIDQNPRTVFNQMNGLINGEMANGFLNNFLG